jgi:hypothetical protein
MMTKICINSNFVSLFNESKILLVHNSKTTLVENFENIIHLELHQHVSNNIYIITKNKFIFAKCKNSFFIKKIFPLPEEIEQIEFVKYLYFHPSPQIIAFCFIVNNKLFYLKDEKLNFLEFENNIKDAYVSFEKKNEYIYLLDSDYNFLILEYENFKLLKKINIYENVVKKLDWSHSNTNLPKPYTKEKNFEIFFILIEDGVLFFYINKYAGKYNTFLIKNNDINLILKNTLVNNFTPFSNFLKLKDEEILNSFAKKLLSLNLKLLSFIVFGDVSSTKIYVLVFWNKKKKYNVFEIHLPNNKKFKNVYAMSEVKLFIN